jgi:predicted deacylase
MHKKQVFLPLHVPQRKEPYTVPFLEVKGKKQGKIITFVAGVHGDEVNSQKMIFDLFHKLSPDALSGTARFFPIFNLDAYEKKSRLFSDGIDINHIMNGRGEAKMPSTQYVNALLPLILEENMHIDLLFDLHSDRAELRNACFAYADMSSPLIKEYAEQLTVDAIIDHKPSARTLRGVCAQKGIPCITIETGEALTYDEQLTSQVFIGLYNSIVQKKQKTKKSPLLFSTSVWQKATEEGYTIMLVKPRDNIKKGQALAICYDMLGNTKCTYTAEFDGYVLVTAKNPVLQIGDNMVHIAKK